MTTNENKASVTYPVVLIEVDGIICRAIPYTASGSSYVSASLVNKLRREPKKIEMMLYTATSKINICDVKIENLQSDFEFKTELNAVDKDVLLTVPNPNYKSMLSDYPHLKGVKMDEFQTKAVLPIHVILGASDFTKIKTKEAPRIGKIGDPTAELTKLGWIIISIEKESNYSHLLLKTSVFSNYEELCSLDAQGISEKEDANNESVLNKFKSQLLEKEGFYETELIWKEGNYKLENNKAGSLGRLNNLLKNLKQEPDKFKEYDDIIKSQLQEGLSR